jgi:light-harvesting protein B-800-850 alpha chain
MNQGRIWTVVNPNHGLPLFLGSVAIIALLVHYSILSHTTWFSAYWQGGAKKAAQIEMVLPHFG